MNTPEVVLIFPRENSVADNNTYRENANAINIDSAVAVRNNYEIYREPLGLESIAANLRSNNYPVKMFFCSFSEVTDESILEYIKAHEVILVGISVLFDRHLEHAIEISKKISKINVPIFFGGPLVSFVAEKILNYANWISGIFIGEGEQTVYEVVDSIARKEDWRKIKGLCYINDNGKVYFNAPMEKVDLDKLPNPSRDFIREAKSLGYEIKVASIYTSRGCAEACTFCTGNQFTKLTNGKVWRGRSPLVVINEIEELIKSYGISYFYICDDNFFGYGKNAKQRILKMMSLIKERNIKAKFHFEMRVDMIDKQLLETCKESGFTDILLGIESGVQSMLDRWKKGITVEENLRAIKLVKSCGLNLKAGFILFDEVTTLEELTENLEFVLKTGLNTPEFVFDIFNPLQIFVNSSIQQNGNYKIFPGAEVKNKTKRDVIQMVAYDYTIRDIRVNIFWEAIKGIVNELNYYFNYYILSYLNQNRKSLPKIQIKEYLRKFNRMYNDLGDILLDISFYTIDRVSSDCNKKLIIKLVKEYYFTIEKKYFKESIIKDLLAIGAKRN